MILTRRQFLKNSAAVLAIPAIVKAENIMKIWVPKDDIEMLPYRGHFRVPDLRGHFATHAPPVGPEMTATEVIQRREEYAKNWVSRWGGHMNQEMARKKAQDESMRAINTKIDNNIMDQLQGQEITGVWIDEAQNIDMRYMIHEKTGETLAFASDAPGYIPCDGRELSAIEFPNLYGVLGNKYG